VGGGTEVVVQLASDPHVQRRALLAARERWRAYRKRDDNPNRSPFWQNDFYHLVSLHWTKFELPEAQIWLEEMLLAIETDPDQGGHFRFGGRVEFHSMRDKELFMILNVLRALRPPDEVEALLLAHPEVAAVAKIYPLGLDSVRAEKPPASQPGQRGRGGFSCAVSSSGRDRGLLEGMMAAHRGDPSAVPQLMSEAGHFYEQDTDSRNPNMAPRAFWPSCHAYKVALYWAGKMLGKDAEPLLDDIPDQDVVLLASIELAAGILGLSQHLGIRMHHPHHNVLDRTRGMT